MALSRLVVTRETAAKLMAETPCEETETTQAGEAVLAAATVSSPFAESWKRREWSGMPTVPQWQWQPGLTADVLPKVYRDRRVSDDLSGDVLAVEGGDIGRVDGC